MTKDRFQFVRQIYFDVHRSVSIVTLYRVKIGFQTAKVFFGVEADKTLDVYGGTLGDLISMIVQRGPAEWAGYVSAIAPLYLQYGVAEKLGKGITQSIKFLDEGDFSPPQLDLWYQAWAAFGDDADEPQIPLQCLHAAIEVLKSDPPNDRPLFRLPLEIRQLVRPLLQKKLNVT
ncbi:MAG: hypothetical protein JNK57_02575 [Planctomycetaceae bacterium]|nr:hypothetical protein [Planctomycetaceae bacterium]